MVDDMETNTADAETLAARSLYNDIRKALRLARSRTLEWDVTKFQGHDPLVQMIFEIANTLDRPARVVWLELVENDSNAEHTYQRELEQAEAERIAYERRQAQIAAMQAKANDLRRRAFEACYPELTFSD